MLHRLDRADGAAAEVYNVETTVTYGVDVVCHVGAAIALAILEVARAIRDGHPRGAQ